MNRNCICENLQKEDNGKYLFGENATTKEKKQYIL